MMVHEILFGDSNLLTLLARKRQHIFFLHASIFTFLFIVHSFSYCLSYFGFVFVFFLNSDSAGWIEWITPRSLSICSHLHFPSECLANIFTVFPLFIIIAVKGCVLPYLPSRKGITCMHSVRVCVFTVYPTDV